MDNLDNNARDTTSANEVGAPSFPSRLIASAIDFMKAIFPNGLWCLSAINPAKKGHIITQTFGPETEAAARAWVDERIGKWNLYFTVNGLRQPMSKKPERADIASLNFLHVDIDPRTGEDLATERQRILALLTTSLPEGVPKPTIVISSGGGYQAFWKLETPLHLDGGESAVEEAKLWNLELERRFGADSCHNIDRIMRLPETINVPDAKKREKGRSPAPTKIVDMDLTRVYPLSMFTAAKPKSNPTASSTAVTAVDLSAGEIKLADVHDLDKHTADGKPVEDRIKRIIHAGYDDLDDQLDGKDKTDRSLWIFDVACALIRRSVPDNVILAVLLDRDFKISEHIYDRKGDTRKYAIRQIERAKERVVDPQLFELNEKHAVLLAEGSKTRVLSWATSELDEARQVPVLQSFKDFENRYMNRFVEVAGADGKSKPIALGRWWLQSLQRRQYQGLRYLPGQDEVVDGYLNLWRGFSVQPKSGSWAMTREHVFHVLARGDRAAFDYIVKWAAWAVQNPDKPAEVALVFKGGRGTGKGTFLRALKQLFGQHGLQITSPSHLTGRFNKHLRDCSLLFADEAIAPGDKGSESVLKGLITEPELMIEGKGIDVIQARNRLHIVMASNEDWVAPAGVDERRFAIFEVSGSKSGDKSYFSAIDTELRSGGLEAMLYDLLTMDLEGWHPRDNVPQTVALAEQKAETLRGFKRFFFELLVAGRMPVDCEPKDFSDADFKVRTVVLEGYAKQQLNRQRVTSTEVGRLLNDLGFEKCRGNFRGYRLPPLKEARAMWSAKMFDVAWDDVSQWELIDCDVDGRPLRCIVEPHQPPRLVGPS